MPKEETAADRRRAKRSGLHQIYLEKTAEASEIENARQMRMRMPAWKSLSKHSYHGKQETTFECLRCLEFLGSRWVEYSLAGCMEHDKVHEQDIESFGVLGRKEGAQERQDRLYRENQDRIIH